MVGDFSFETYRVRTMSMGARMRPAIPAAPTATAILATGLGLSSILMLPAGLPSASNVASGRSSIADSRLLVHVSIVRSSTLYTKVLFVPFQTPHAPSFDHSCVSTSMRESFRRSSSAYRCEVEDAGLECVEGVGVADKDREGGLRLRRLEGDDGVS